MCEVISSHRDNSRFFRGVQSYCFSTPVSTVKPGQAGEKELGSISAYTVKQLLIEDFETELV